MTISKDNAFPVLSPDEQRRLYEAEMRGEKPLIEPAAYVTLPPKPHLRSLVRS